MASIRIKGYYCDVKIINFFHIIYIVYGYDNYNKTTTHLHDVQQ